MQNKIINQQTLSLIKEFEGFSHLVYECPAGLDTIGYGHVVSDAEKVKYKFGISEKEATDLLISDCKIVLQCLSKLIKVDLKENQLDALISLVFNIGCTRFGKSRGLAYINQYNFDLAKKELFDSKLGFVKIGDTISNGLVRRRQKELELWNLNV